MKELTLRFQEEQICYCSNFMYDNLAAFYSTFRDVNDIIKANDYHPTDIVTATISPENLLALSATLGTQQEGLTSAFHAALNMSLLGQLQTIASGQDADEAVSAMFVLTELQKRGVYSAAWIKGISDAGRQKLKM
jgi:hypothetical protein